MKKKNPTMKDLLQLHVPHLFLFTQDLTHWERWNRSYGKYDTTPGKDYGITLRDFSFVADKQNHTLDTERFLFNS